MQPGRSRFSSHSAGIATTFFMLMVVLAFHSGNDLLLQSAVAGFSLLTYPYWHRRLPGQIALLMVAAEGVIVLVSDSPIHIAAGLRRYQTVIELLSGIALLQQIGGRLGLQEVIRRYSHKIALRWRALVIGAGTALLAVPLGVAAIALVSAVLSTIATPRLASAKIAMRPVILVTLVLPTTITSATVSASLPRLSSGHVLLLGLPLFLTGIASLAGIRLQVGKEESLPDSGRNKRIIVFGLGFFLILGVSLLLRFPIPEGVALASLVLYLVNAIWERRTLMEVARQANSAFSKSSAEIILLFACGILAVLIVDVGDIPALHYLINTFWNNPWLAYSLLIFIMPLISAFGIHPLILFNLLFPIVNSAILGGLTLQYLAWSAMFIASQLISPISISAILAASSVGVSPDKTSYKLNLKFTVALCFVIYGYLNLLRCLGLG